MSINHMTIRTTLSSSFLIQGIMCGGCQCVDEQEYATVELRKKLIDCILIQAPTTQEEERVPHGRRQTR